MDNNLYMKSGVGYITDTIINQCIQELNKKETREKVNKNILNPIIEKINRKIYPYFLTFSVLIIIILVLIIIIFFSLILKNKS